MVVFFQGCKKDTYLENAGLCPLVVSTDPANLAINVPLNQVITATFNQEMNPVTITPASFTLESGAKGMAAVVGVVSYADSTATFTPSSVLLANTTYTGTLKTAIKDAYGNSLQTDYVWTFTTVPHPIVLSTSPANNDINVPLNKIITATFEEPVDPLTLTGATFTLMQGANPVAGAVSYSGSTASFIPTVNLTSGTVYIATITTGVKNSFGIPMAGNYVWSFTTGTLVAPTVLVTDPADDEIGVLLNKVVTATFSVPMDPLTITAANFTLFLGATAVPGTVTYAGSTASFTPTASLASGSTYTATIKTGARDVPGTAMANDFVWTFTTVSTGVPTVTSTDPLNLATGVALNKVVTASFSTAMDPLTITAATFTLKQGATVIAGTVTYSGTTASFTPAANLTTGLVYTATVTAGAKNILGTAIAADYVWSFTTGALTAPTVTSTDPLNLANGVLVNKVLTANFSVPMDPLTITGTTFTLKRGAVVVTGTISYSGTAATFTPASNLLAGTVYTATITTGAKNVAGTPLASNYVWTFTTLTLTPSVTSVTPLNNSTGVPQNSVVTANFSIPMDPLTITGATFSVKQGLTPVAGVVSYLGLTATFTPSAILMSGSTFTVTITSGARSAGGVPLPTDKVWYFSTSAKGPGIVNLGTAGNFAAIGKTGISTTGTTFITGDIGVSPSSASSITGFGLVMDVSNTFSTTVPTNLVTGKVYASNYNPPTPAYMTQAVSDMETALTNAMGLTTTVIVDLGAGDISGMTLAPGLYKYNTGLLITASGVTLAGGPQDTWVFQISSDLTVNNGAIITLAGGAQAKNIFWVTNTQAVLGTGVDFKGNILGQTLISLNTGAKVLGSLLSQTAVTLNAATVIKP